MAERVALKPLDPNARMSKSAIGTASSKIPRAANAGKSAENDGNEKQALEAKLHEVLDEYDEVRTQYGELEEHSRQLKVAYINMEEEAAEWKKSYESLQAEGTELFQTYERKCAMLKEVSRQLEDHKQKLVERDARLKELQRSKESAEQERDEQREKTKAHNDIISKHESRYLSLKEEHNQTLVKLDALQQQLREAMRSAPRADCAPQQEVVGTLDTLQIKKMEKMLEEADTREKKAREELQSVKQQMHRLMQGDNTACTSPDNVSALQATSATPARGFLPKTPSGAMLEMANLSPESLYERAESLLISNDLLRQVLL
jgi:chromosome segregation ATPase